MLPATTSNAFSGTFKAARETVVILIKRILAAQGADFFVIVNSLNAALVLKKIRIRIDLKRILGQILFHIVVWRRSCGSIKEATQRQEELKECQCRYT